MAPIPIYSRHPETSLAKLHQRRGHVRPRQVRQTNTKWIRLRAGFQHTARRRRLIFISPGRPGRRRNQERNGIPWTPEELARDSAMAEWFIGTRGGSMDHITICLAETAHAVLIDYASGQTRLAALPDQPFAWVTFFTKP